MKSVRPTRLTIPSGTSWYIMDPSAARMRRTDDRLALHAEVNDGLSGRKRHKHSSIAAWRKSWKPLNTGKKMTHSNEANKSNPNPTSRYLQKFNQFHNLFCSKQSVARKLGTSSNLGTKARSWYSPDKMKLLHLESVFKSHMLQSKSLAWHALRSPPVALHTEAQWKCLHMKLR